MRNPFTIGKELRAAQDRIASLEARDTYTELVSQALFDAAAGTANDGYTAALEIASGGLARAFATAKISGVGDVLFNADILAQIGRSLVQGGESIWFRQADQLLRVDNYGLQPSGDYQVSLADGPEFVVDPSRVLHVRWSWDINSGRGIGPLQRASTINALMRAIEGSLRDESGIGVGYLLPMPVDPGRDNVRQFREDLKALKGDIVAVQTTQGQWQGANSPGSQRRDFELTRIGPDYPDSAINLLDRVVSICLHACGYPVQLAMGTDGTGQREAWRRYLHGTVSPLGKMVELASERINAPVQLDFEDLFASDIQGRARAFQSLVVGGMDIERAATVSGILNREDAE